MWISDWSSAVCSSDRAAVRETLADATLDAAFIGGAVLLPSENFIGDQLAVVEPEAIFRARATLRRDLGTALEPLWRAAHADNAAEHYAYTPAAKGRRRLRNVALEDRKSTRLNSSH